MPDPGEVGPATPWVLRPSQPLLLITASFFVAFHYLQTSGRKPRQRGTWLRSLEATAMCRREGNVSRSAYPSEGRLQIVPSTCLRAPAACNDEEEVEHIGAVLEMTRFDQTCLPQCPILRV